MYIMKKQTYKWSITLKKVAVTSLAILIAGGVSVWQNNPLWLASLPLLQGLQNYLKHRKE